MGSDGNTGDSGNVTGRKRVRKNVRADRRGRVGAAKDAVRFAVPQSVAWALGNPQLTRDKFTPWEWQVLKARYPVIERWGGIRNSSVVVGRILEMTGKSGLVQKAEAAAHRRAYELCYGWAPARMRWHAWKAGEGPRPSSKDFELLAKYRKRSGVKGRRKVEELRSGWLPLPDPMDDWRPDADGGDSWRPVGELQTWAEEDEVDGEFEPSPEGPDELGEPDEESDP